MLKKEGRRQTVNPTTRVSEARLEVMPPAFILEVHAGSGGLSEEENFHSEKSHSLYGCPDTISATVIKKTGNRWRGAWGALFHTSKAPRNKTPSRATASTTDPPEASLASREAQGNGVGERCSHLPLHLIHAGCPGGLSA